MDKNYFDKIKDLNLQQISKQTHIDIDSLKAIFNNDFEALKDKNVQAYVKILEREYGLELDDFLGEYCSFISEIKVKERPYLQPIAKKSSGFSISQAQEKKGKAIFFIVVIWLIIIGTILYFQPYFDISKILSIGSEEPALTIEKQIEANNSVVQRAKNKLQDEGIIFEHRLNTQDNNITTNTTQELNSQNLENNQTIIQTEDNNTSLSNTSSLLDREKDQEEDSSIKKIATLNAENKIWIGIKFMKNSKKESLVIDKQLNLDLTQEQIILTGHSNFSIQIGEKTMKFKDKSRIILHIKDGEIKEISENEFIRLNGNKSW